MLKKTKSDFLTTEEVVMKEEEEEEEKKIRVLIGATKKNQKLRDQNR